MTGPASTIRDHLRRRSRLALLAVFLCAMALATATAFQGRALNPALALLIVAGLAGSIVGVLLFVRCPRCSGNMAALVNHFSPLARLSTPVN